MEKSRAPAADKIVQILDLLADSPQPQSGAEIARALALPRSSVHVLLTALERADVVRKSGERHYSVGMRTVRWAGGYLAEQDIVSAFHQVLSTMPQLNRYTLTLSALEGDKVVYLACKNSSAPLGFSFRLGMQVPAVFTATGKWLLASLDDTALESRITHFPPPETEASVQTMDALKAELYTVRKQGYAVDNGQLRRGMFCYGVGIAGADGQAQYGIALSLLEAEADAATVRERVHDLQQLAQRLQSVAAVR